MSWLIWSNVGPAGGENLAKIIMRKEAERVAGNGTFWWGLGTRLGPAIEATAVSNKGVLPALFSEILGQAQEKDSDPANVCLWNGWRSVDNRHQGALPDHVLVTGGQAPGDEYYALVCTLATPLQIGDHGVFDRTQYRTRNGKPLGYSQRAALLESFQTGVPQGRDRVVFRANLIAPCYVRLTHGDVLTKFERQMVDRYASGDNWLALVRNLRGNR